LQPKDKSQLTVNQKEVPVPRNKTIFTAATVWLVVGIGILIITGCLIYGFYFGGF
jgi:hypothetical protein